MTVPPVTAAFMRDWSRHAQGSPLYVELCDVVAGSDELLRVINRIDNPPPPNVLFAAVHFLLLRGEGPELARFYPSIVAEPDQIEGVAGPFRDFVLAHEEQIVMLGRTRYTQTNECRRCTALLPAIWETGLSRFHLVDVGASAGLNLALDRYRYRWGDVEWGPRSPVVLEAETRGRAPSPGDIAVLSRTGLDLHPVDLDDPDDRLWLEALVWPEHSERRRRLDMALETLDRLELAMIRGTALETLEPFLENLPDGDPAVVMHSFVFNQLNADDQGSILETIDAARRRRPVARVFLEHMRPDDAWSTIGVDVGSGPTMIGRGHPHGEWIELYARP